MITKEQLVEMLKLQDTFNKTVNQDWITADYKWTDAVMVESTELVAHVGWKWWKKQEMNVEQAKLELIDIWHFILSIYMTKQRKWENYIDLAADTLLNEFITTKALLKTGDIDEIKCSIRTLIHFSSISQIRLDSFMHLLAEFDITPDKLHELYVGKNVLNLFRQNHGYKDGTYIKVWDGREDNEVLADIMATNKFSIDELYSELDRVYSLN